MNYREYRLVLKALLMQNKKLTVGEFAFVARDLK